MTETTELTTFDSELLEVRIRHLRHELEECHQERNTALAQLLELRLEAETQVCALQAQLRQIEEVSARSQAAHNEQLTALTTTVADREIRITTLNQAIVDREARIAALNEAIDRCELRITALDQAIVARDTQIADRDTRIATLSQAVAERDKHLSSLHSSSSWRVTAPMRQVKRSWPRVRRLIAGWARALYLAIPLPMALKIRLKGLIFALLSPLLGTTASYRAWVEFERKKADLKQGSPRPGPLIEEWVRAIYRAIPIPGVLKVAFKGMIFALFSPLLSHTASYQAWVLFEQAKSRGKPNPSRLRPVIGEWVRALYLVTPLPMALKVRIKGLIFALFSPLLRTTTSYQAWVAFEQAKRGIALPWPAGECVAAETPAAAPAQFSETPGAFAAPSFTEGVDPVPDESGPQTDSAAPAAGKEEPPLAAPLDDAPYRALYEQKFQVASLKEADDYVPIDESGIEVSAEAIRLIAFYLPQFHPIPLNDIAWGKGFTEWTNVSKAVPQFVGHYQPHLPGELGFYDLRVPDVQRRQIDLAKLYGIYGFCFHFYWFAGTRLLERPLDQFLSDPSLDFPFCICWANENWTRRWDGDDHEVLIAQKHTSESDTAFIEDIALILADRRYIRVEGKPLLIVYRPDILPDAASTAQRWRTLCEHNGLGEIFLVAARTFGLTDPTPFGFDAAVEFPPHNFSSLDITDEMALVNRNFTGHVYDFPDLAMKYIATYKKERYPVFRCVCPSWDNEARRPGAGHIYHHATPTQYERWLSAACAYAATEKTPDKRLVFVNAWNEWAEGAHIEPDRRFGYAYLDHTKKVVRKFSDRAKRPRIAVIVGLFHADLWAEIRRLLYNLPEPFHLYVTLPVDFPIEGLAQVRGDFPLARILRYEGRERDVPAFFQLIDEVDLGQYQFVCKLESKKSVRDDCGELWRQEPWELLLGSPETVERIFDLFELDPRLSVVGPSEHILWHGKNRGEERQASADELQTLAPAQLSRIDQDDAKFYYVGGSMYWFRPTALDSLSNLKFPATGLEPGAGGTTDTVEDGFARLLGRYLKEKDLLIGDTSGLVYDSRLPASDSGKPSFGPKPSHIHLLEDRQYGAVAAHRTAGESPDAISTRTFRRLVYVCHDAIPCGAQLLSLNIVRSLAEHFGYTIELLLMGPGPLAAEFSRYAKVHELWRHNHQPQALAELIAQLKSRAFGHAICNTAVVGHVVGLLKEQGFDVLCLIHEMPGVLESYGLLDAAEVLAARADRIVFAAAPVLEGFRTLIPFPQQKAVIRPQGLYHHNHFQTSPELARSSIRSELGLRPDARIVLGAGWADHRKGVDLFVEVGLRVVKKKPDVFFVWIGDTETHSDALSAARNRLLESKYSEHFRFVGQKSDPGRWFNAADIYALTSREDPFPSVVLEAMDAGLPIVGFEGTGGACDLITRGVGALAPAFDTDAMAGIVSELLGDPPRCETMGALGKEVIESEFSWTHYLFDLLELLGHRYQRVSAIVPNYNYARYLESRLDSVLHQTYPVYEVIVLDDASDDDSLATIRHTAAKAEREILLRTNEKNSGSVFKQWKLGASLAKGDFVWIAEADDLADPSFLERVLAPFSDPAVVLSYCQSRQMDEEGRILSPHYLDYVSDVDERRWNSDYRRVGIEEIRDSLAVKNTIPNVSAVVFRSNNLRKALEEEAAVIARFRIAGDWVVYARLLSEGDVAFTARALNNHRRHQRGITIASDLVGHYNEVLSVQQLIARRYGASPEAARKARDYIQRLSVQFGLAATENDDGEPRTDFPEHDHGSPRRIKGAARAKGT